MIPIVKASKFKSECVIPAKLLNDSYKVDTNTLIDWFVSPIKKFFGKSDYEQ